MRLEWDDKFPDEFLHSPEIVRIVDKAAAEITEGANTTMWEDGYEYSTKHGQRRYRAHVYPETTHAIRSNMKHQTLKKIVMSVSKMGVIYV